MRDHAGQRLISSLLADPRQFNDDGRAYDLLQAYFDGLPVETLRPLLRSEDPLVQRAAVFVTAELGVQAGDLIDDVIPLLAPENRYIQYHAMEILTVCCEGERAGEFAHVISQLESGDDVLRALAMRLVARADASQLVASRRVFARESGRQTHERGLQVLISEEGVDLDVVAGMIGNADPLVRRYGAIAARRLVTKHPTLMEAVGSSDDKELRGFHHDSANAQPQQ